MKSAFLFLLCAPLLCADDGMWLFNQFPAETVKAKYEFDVTPAFLDHLRLSTVTLPGGSGGFVSPAGLVVTNWHLVSSCVPHSDTGAAFYAASGADEVRCPGMAAKVLVALEDITARINPPAPAASATAPKVATKDAAAAAAQALTERNTTIAKIEAECAAKSGNLCSVVSLYSGGRYDLYQYKLYTDLRLVFAPEQQLAYFGGARDTITYLRYGLDAAFLRAYENGKPAATPNYFKWSPEMVKDGDLQFAAGSPATTSRSTTVAQLNFYRDVSLPVTMARLGARLKPLNKFAAVSEENKKVAEGVQKPLLEIYKSAAGRLIGLRDKRLQVRKTLFEAKIRNVVERDPKLGTEGGKVWDQIAAAYKAWTPYEKAYQILDSGPAYGSTLFRIARKLVEGQELGADADAPVNDGLEIAMVSLYLDEVKTLGEKEMPLKALLGKQTSDQAAEAFVKSSHLGDPAVRKRFAADRASVSKADDGMLRLARILEDVTVKIRKKRLEVIGALEVSAAQRIAQYRMQLFGAADYPDATGTPRVCYGVPKSYIDRAGVDTPYAATFSGLFYRRNNEGPRMVPQNWVDLQSSLHVVTPLDFATTCDIGGGDYGAPTVNKAGELTGIIFDGNLESLPAIYLYTEDQARAVHVAAQGIAESLDKVYKAGALLRELGIIRTGGTGDAVVRTSTRE